MSTTHRSSRVGQPVTHRRGGPPALPFRVFLGYADVPAVRGATATINDAIRSTGRSFAIEPMLWSFAQLANAYWRDRAVRAALDADIVVLASSRPGALSADIEAWIEAFLAANRGRRATIVAISGPADAWTISIEAPPAATSVISPSVTESIESVEVSAV